jgi:glycosyltransferase involved in cell wall biosynthesis
MLSKKIDSYIALSKYVKRAYTQFGFSPEKIKVIPNFADNNFLNKLDVQKVEHSFVILYVGRLSDEKGVDILLKAFSKLSQKEKHAKLVLVGAGPATKRYMHLVDHLNITEKTRFLGKLSNNDVWKVYATADVMVHPAIWPEPFGRTLLEAMSCNIPLIVSSAGAPPEIIENAGVVFESGNIDDLLEKIQTVMKNSHQLNQMKSSCSIVLGKYALDKILYEILALYTDLVNTYAE